MQQISRGIYRSILSLLGFIFLVSCSTLSLSPKTVTHLRSPKPPLTPNTINLSEGQLTQLSQKLRVLHQAQLLESPIPFDEKTTAIEAFHKSHEAALRLLQKNNVLECANFIIWLQQYVFQPPASYSFTLLKILATYRMTSDLEAFVRDLNTPTLDIAHTPFQEAMAFLEQGLPLLARSGHTSLALHIVDKIFETYGSVDSIFEKIQQAYMTSPLQASLMVETPQNYKTESVSGLIAAEQIIALYDQLRFTEVKKQGTTFLDTFAHHPWAPKIAKLVQEAIPKTQWKGFRIALLLPLSGPYAQVGNDIMEGIFYSFHVFDSEETGASKSPFEFFPLDTHAHPQDLAEKLTDLIHDESIFLIIGPYLTQTHKEMVPVAQKHHIPLLSLAPVEQQDSDTHSVMVMRPSLSYQLQFMINYLHTHLHEISNVAILYPDNGFGYFQANAFQQAVDSTGKTLVAAEIYLPGAQKTYKPAAEKLLSIFDTQDRVEERKEVALAYQEKHTKPPRPNQIELPPITNFELLYIPSPIRDASILAPLFKYFGATHFMILGPPVWNKEDMVIRTQPYLENVILFDTFAEAENQPSYVDFAQKFKQKYNQIFNQDHFLGKLTADIVLKALSQVTPNDIASREDFLKQIQQVKGRTFLDQEWIMAPNGILHLDPIPLAFQKNTFVRISEEMVAKIRETVFPIKIHEGSSEKVKVQ